MRQGWKEETQGGTKITKNPGVSLTYTSVIVKKFNYIKNIVLASLYGVGVASAWFSRRKKYGGAGAGKNLNAIGYGVWNF